MLANRNFDFYFTKATFIDGQYRWASTCSDTGLDAYTERMSVPLFKSFIENWKTKNYKIFGSLSHYPSLAGFAEWGEVTDLYIDGDRLKAKGIFSDSRIGRAVYESIRKDRTENVPPDKRVRTSIGFYVLKYHIGDKTWVYGEDAELLMPEPGEIKIYDAGILEHLAVTRIPANKRASIQILSVEKSERSDMTTNVMRRDDALSIVNDPDIVNEIESKLADEPTTKSDQVLVEKAVDETPTPVKTINVLELLSGFTPEECRTGLETLLMKMNPDGTLDEDEVSKRIAKALGWMAIRSEDTPSQLIDNPVVETVAELPEVTKSTNAELAPTGGQDTVVKVDEAEVPEPVYRALVTQFEDGLARSTVLEVDQRRAAFQELVASMVNGLQSLDAQLEEKSQSGVVDSDDLSKVVDRKFNQLASTLDQKLNGFNAQLVALTELVSRMAVASTPIVNNAPAPVPTVVAPVQAVPVQKSIQFDMSGVPVPRQAPVVDPNQPMSIRDIVRRTVY